MGYKDVVVGAKVVHCDDFKITGTVTQVNGNSVSIKWNHPSMDEGEEHNHSYHDSFILESDIPNPLYVQNKINETVSLLEKAFDALRELREIDNAGMSLWQLNRNGQISLKELEKTVESGGWNSSSLWC